MTSRLFGMIGAGTLVLVLGYALGGAVSQSRALDDSTYFGEDAPGRGPTLTMVAGQLKGSPDTEVLYVLRQSDQKLAVYLLNGATLELRHMRALQPDFDVGEAYSRSGNTQSPTPEEMRKLRKP